MHHFMRNHDIINALLKLYVKIDKTVKERRKEGVASQIDVYQGNIIDDYNIGGFFNEKRIQETNQ